MIDVPFWVKSPSPFTLAFWLLMIFWSIQYLPEPLGKYRIIDAAWILGLIVLSFDAAWCILQFKFAYLHPEGVLQLILSLARDLTLLFFCYTQTYPYFKQKKLTINPYTIILTGILVCYMLLWFSLSPDPSWTDWTYSIRFEYGNLRTIQAFIISHFGAKFLQGLIFISLFVW